MILPDTSVWVEYLRSGPPPSESGGQSAAPADALDALIGQGQIVTCGPVAAELLAGARGGQREELAAQLSAQPWIELKRSEWMTVGRTAAALQEQGRTVPLVDVQIAVCATLAKAELWTRDSDFERVAEALDGLQLRVFP